MAEVLCLGQAVIDCIVRDREEDPIKKNVYRAESIGISIGGDSVNESVILSRLGHDVKLCCLLGDDPAGRLIVNELKKENIDTSAVIIDKELETPIANLMVGKDGSRNSTNCAATMLGGKTPDVEVVKDVKILSLASLFRAPLDRPETIFSLIRKAKEQGIIVCADTKLANYRKIDLNDIKEILPYVDYFFPNENEAAFYTGETEYSKMAEVLKSYGIKNVIIKTGPDGCFVNGEKEIFTVPAYKVNAVDTTGAGDNFVAGFISGLLQNKTLRECVEFGTACAAVSVQAIGASAGVTDKKKVYDFIEGKIISK